MPLTYRDEDHSYSLDGVPLPSVTGILKDLGLTPQYPPGNYKVRGKRVHKACCLVDDGTIDQYDLGPELAGYVASYRYIQEHFDFVWSKTEEPNYDKVLLVAGTPDRVGVNRVTGNRVVLDLKTGKPGDEVRLQLAGYVHMEFTDNLADVERYRVYLDADGKRPKIMDYLGSKYAIDFPGYVGAVNFWKWGKCK